jgi:hypothetical protein
VFAPEVASMIQLMREQTLPVVKVAFNYRENLAIADLDNRDFSVKMHF